MLKVTAGWEKPLYNLMDFEKSMNGEIVDNKKMLISA